MPGAFMAFQRFLRAVMQQFYLYVLVCKLQWRWIFFKICAFSVIYQQGISLFVRKAFYLLCREFVKALVIHRLVNSNFHLFRVGYERRFVRLITKVRERDFPTLFAHKINKVVISCLPGETPEEGNWLVLIITKVYA